MSVPHAQKCATCCRSAFRSSVSLVRGKACFAQKGEDDSDALPFVSRPKAVKVTKAQPYNAMAKATTVSGAVSSYDEMQDEDTEVEADDPGPESTLEGDHSASGFQCQGGRAVMSCNQ